VIMIDYDEMIMIMMKLPATHGHILSSATVVFHFKKTPCERHKPS